MRLGPIQTSKRWFRVLAGLFLVIFMLMLWIDYVNYKRREELAKERESDQRYAMLQSRINFLAMEFERKEAEIMRIKYSEANKATDLSGADEQDIFFKTITEIMTNISDGFPFVRPVQNPLPLSAELTVTTMRHLLNHPDARYPAFQIISPRPSSQIDVVIGIPTVQRNKETYLLETIQSLIDGMTDLEKTRTLIVVSIGETIDLQFIAETALNINKVFPDYYGQLIEVISPNHRWYPPWKSVHESLGDSFKRTVWRTKQNLDAIFLMSYAQSRATYYLMMEDDVLAKTGYMKEMMQFTSDQTESNPGWFFINFSSVGGIGKLFRSIDLVSFNSYVQVFYPYMPIDWLTESYLGGRVCGLGSKDCANLKNTIRPTYKKSLFEHIGLYSSLRGKLHKVKKNLRSGKTVALFYPHDNPPLAKIESLVKSIGSHTITRAYIGKDYFSGTPPKANDTITFWFESAISLQMFYIGSGNTSHYSNGFQRSIVEVLQIGKKHFQYVDKFDEFGVCEGNLENFQQLRALRIRVLTNMKHPVIINEIKIQPAAVKPAIFTPKYKNSKRPNINR